MTEYIIVALKCSCLSRITSNVYRAIIYLVYVDMYSILE